MHLASACWQGRAAHILRLFSFRPHRRPELLAALEAVCCYRCREVVSMSVCVVVRAMYCANTDELQMIIVVAEVSVAVAEKRILQISACIRWIVLQKIRSELRLLLQILRN